MFSILTMSRALCGGMKVGCFVVQLCLQTAARKLESNHDSAAKRMPEINGRV